MNTATANETGPAVTASHAAFKKYGVSPSTLTYCILNHFSFPKDFRDCLSSYYILRWQKSYFFSSLQEGTIFRDGISYAVVYKNCNPSSIKKEAKEVLLSFRAPQPEFGNTAPAVVLVTIAPPAPKTSFTTNQWGLAS